VGRRGDRHQPDDVEIELVQRLLGHDEVGEVRRVERAPEDPEPAHP
jgi:hypothetical protein